MIVDNITAPIGQLFALLLMIVGIGLFFVGGGVAGIGDTAKSEE